MCRGLVITGGRCPARWRITRRAKPDVGRLQVLAVQQHLDRLGVPAVAEAINAHHRIRLRPREVKDGPLISILICSKDAAELISRCLDSIFQKTTYPQFEVLVADNNTTDPAALEVLGRHKIRRLLMPEKFHFAAFNNRLAREAKGEYLVFLNNDTEVLQGGWLEELLLYARQTDAGAVGPVLFVSGWQRAACGRDPWAARDGGPCDAKFSGYQRRLFRLRWRARARSRR